MTEKVLTCLNTECEYYLMPFVPPEKEGLKIPCPNCDKRLRLKTREEVAKFEAKRAKFEAKR